MGTESFNVNYMDNDISEESKMDDHLYVRAPCSKPSRVNNPDTPDMI